MEINARKVANKHIVIGCTIIPGYIEETGTFLIQDCTNTSLSYHPEFIAQGDIMNGRTPIWPSLERAAKLLATCSRR